VHRIGIVDALKTDAERRRHSRVPASIPFKLKAGGKAEKFDLMDLSESGVRIRCARSLPAMTRIQVSMVLPAKRVGGKSDVRVETTGVVVWSHKADTKSFDTGVFFSELEDHQRTTLRAFVMSHV
jgi:c-di-GMP-binding flagellar brake protein YcgR